MATQAPDAPAIVAKRDVIITGSTVVSAPGGIVNLSTGIHESTALGKLESRSSPDALHSSAAVARQDICTPGTRTVTLARLRSFATDSDPTAPDVLWMHGPAGAGKSAIMRTLAQDLSEDRALLGTFFFFRAASERNTPAPFIPTLALQLSTKIPETRPYIAHAIQENPTIFSQLPHTQCPHLLSEPLSKAFESAPSHTAHPYVIIIDGLDECTDLPGQGEIITAMVQLASSIRSHTDRRIKVLIVSRPERGIKPVFEKLARSESDDGIVVVSLDSSDANIELYYDEQLDKIRQQHNLPESWPSAEDIKWLREKTSGQYAFAGVSTRFMAGGDPVIRLQTIRKALQVPNLNLQPFETLDQLYATVLHQIPPEMLKPTLHILHLRLHPSWSTNYNVILERLLGLPTRYAQRIAPYLSSLIDFDDGLRPYHASLADLLFDPSRSDVHSLTIHPSELDDAFIQGLLAPGLVSSQGFSVHEMAAYLRFVGLSSAPPDCHVNVLWLSVTHNTQLVSRLNNLNIAQYGLWSLTYFAKLCDTFRKPGVNANLMLSLAVRYSLPRRIRASSSKQIAPISNNEMDLVMGLLQFVISNDKVPIHKREPFTLLLDAITSSNEELRRLFLRPTLTSTVHWRTEPAFTLSAERTKFILRHRSHRDYSRSFGCLLSVFSAKARPTEGWARPHVARIIDCGQTHGPSEADVFQCLRCLSTLSHLQQSIIDSFYSNNFRKRNGMFIELYHFMRGHPVLWNDKNVRRAMDYLGDRVLNNGRVFGLFNMLRPQIIRTNRLLRQLRLRLRELHRQEARP